MILKNLSEYLVKLSRAETQYSSSAYIPEHESNNMSPSTAITPNSKSQAEDQKSGDEYLVSSNNVDSPDVSQDGDDVTKDVAPMGTKKALIAWLILCYSTGPTSSVAFTYVSAAMQSLTNLVGHVPGSTRACATRGTIRCVVKFGGGEINYASYVLYLNAIGRAMEGILTILISGVADYSYYRKRLMMGSIFLFGTIALPFAGLTGQSYSYLTALSVLYCCLTTIQGVYVVIEASYIPIFMRSVGWFKERPRIEHGDVDPSAEEVANRTKRHVFKKGARVSVLGLVASNVGGMTALLIGIVITYTRGTPRETGYHNFLLAITIAGSITICFAIIGGILLPSVPGKTKPPGTNLALLPFQRWLRTIKSIQKYPQAFKLCIGWILWNTGYSNFLSVNSLLFREVSGLTVGTGVYTVWQFTAIIFAVMGSLTWMFTFPLFKFPVKRWAYFFLSVNIACVLWGCIGIADVSIGYKHVAEFWVEQVLFMSTSSALRSFNRVLYSSMLPRGAEAQFFGLEITLDLATGWINPLVQGVIQDRTGNLRFPMIPNLCLMVIALCIYIWVDVERGIEDAKQEME